LAGRLKSKIELDNFYGIEIDDFACEVAVLSLYLAKHQMNIEFEKQFGQEIKLIPLKDKANIVHANAARIDWQDVCPNKPTRRSIIEDAQMQLILTELDNQPAIEEEFWDEIYLIGNPPYQGARLQDAEQKKDFTYAYGYEDYSKNLDYISIWFKKGASYISESKAQLAFVSTNSICQGEHTSLLWPSLYRYNIEIGFAHTSFKWTNSASNQAGVYCIIVGLRTLSDKKKLLFSENIVYEVKNINAYLSASESNLIIERRNTPISVLPHVCFGSMANDGGHLIFSNHEYLDFVNKYPKSVSYFRKFVGAEEFIKGTFRWVLWLTEESVTEAIKIDELDKRIKLVAIARMKSKRGATKKLAKYPYRFGENRHTEKQSIIIPKLSSERREYIPIGYIDGNTIISDRAFMVPDAALWVFSLLNSKSHMIWTSAVAGRLKIDINYSTTIVYNNFPFPDLSQDKRKELDMSARRILLARENHTEKTLSEMYDPDKMPSDLREAHHQNDILVDRLYRQKPYTSDEERLADLFKLYEEMIANEKE
jgi:hypothetical protein